MKEILQLPSGCKGTVWRVKGRGRKLPMHRHAELEMNLIVHGRGEYLLRDRRYTLHSGDMIWLFPEQEHLLVRQSDDCDMWVLVFSPELLRESCRRPDTMTLRQSDPAGPFCRRLPRETAACLAAFLETLEGNQKNIACYNAGLQYVLLWAWAEHRAAPDVPPGPELHPAVEKAAYRILRKPESPSLKEISRSCGLSAWRLSRLFKWQMGVSLVEFRNRRRVARFLDLYQTGQRQTMMRAAYEAGFGSYAQFHRAFKRSMGVGPAVYRRRVAD